jgi:hypothetical protein
LAHPSYRHIPPVPRTCIDPCACIGIRETPVSEGGVLANDHAIIAHVRRYPCFPIAPLPAVAIASSIPLWTSLGALTGAVSVLYTPNAIPKGALSGNHYKRMALPLTAHVILSRIFSSRPLPRKVASLC